MVANFASRLFPHIKWSDKDMPATVMKCYMMTRGGDVYSMEPDKSSAMG